MYYEGTVEDISQRIRFNDLDLHAARRCNTVNVGISRRFQAHLTQFLHSFRLHLFRYVRMFFGTLVEATCWGSIDISVAR